LRRADLSGVEFHAADLRAADLSGADLYGAYFTSANLRDANLTGVIFRFNTNLEGSDLRGAI